MDATTEALLLRYGWQGVVIAVVLVVSRVIGPEVAKLLPAWMSASAKREDQLLEALRAATTVMTEMVSELRSLRVEVGAVRADQHELRSDVEYVADQLKLPRPREVRARTGRQKKPEADEAE